ncbi:antibiotic biosynthesis monooxygenase [Motilimonas cestriensis]|uniref:Antibiotic biosynthesis monooxygenase n=1 Tax=Motilimonas cestriensis TaxID=2742685 RepID=A0ABS8W5H3_9GAMM|nr:antibiotic biosynthesis monooxygenase [Motilimonas cestriensis]MCE2593642.1 antibiotic biosynthesis monooxygenase [Motilimonas cestriensis]
MYAVIFRAKPGIQDDEYSKTVANMRELAFEKYGCLDFVAVTEGDQEIAISYWESEQAIKQWKSDSEHALAQELGRTKWYESYIVQVVEIKREYQFNP